MKPRFNSALSLTPRQQRTLLDVTTALVIVSVAVALAGLTWRIAGHAGTGAILVPPGARGAGPAPVTDVAPAIAFAPFGKADADAMGQPTGLPLELRGVVAAVPDALSTAFIAVSGQAARGFHVGDAVNGATIKAILRDRVLLTNGGRAEYLAFPDPTLTPEQRQAAAQGQRTGQPPAQAAAPAQSPLVQGVANAPGTPAAVPPAAASTLLQRFDASPAPGGGYRIGDNAPPGMVPGDVIQSVNGNALTDPVAANAAFSAAQSSGSAQVQILRNGRRITLTVPIR